MRKKRIRLRPLGWVLFVFLPLCILLLLIRSCGQNPVELTDALGVPVHTFYVKENSPSRPGISREIRYLVLHETGNESVGSDAKNHAIYLRFTNDTSTSWHYTVDDTCIYHHIPDGEVAWHASDRLEASGGNRNGIGIELCVNADGDFEKTFDNAARLAACLLEAYNLTVEDIKQHADFTSKNCPQRIRDANRMEEFKEKVAAYQKEIRGA